MNEQFSQQAERTLELAGELTDELESEDEIDRLDQRVEELASRCNTLTEQAGDSAPHEAQVELLQRVKRAVDEALELARLRRKRLGTQLRHLGRSEQTLDSYRGGKQRRTRLDRKG